MITLQAKTRKDLGKKVRLIRGLGKIPAVVYGPESKNTVIEVDEKEKICEKSGACQMLLI